MRNFQDTFETRKRSFNSPFSFCLTVPLSDLILRIKVFIALIRCFQNYLLILYLSFCIIVCYYEKLNAFVSQISLYEMKIFICLQLYSKIGLLGIFGS